MKKKVLFTILTLGCVAGCAAGLSACGGGGGGGGGEKRLDSVVLVDSNDVAYHEYDMGTFYYGSPEQPDLDSLRLKANYTDNTTEWLDKNGDFVSITYRYNGEDMFTLNKPYEVGNYSVAYYYTYNTQSLGAFLTFEIKPSATSSPYSLELSATSWKYLEDPTMTVKKGDDTVQTGYSIYAITEEKYNEIKDAPDFLEQLENDTDHNISVYYSENVNPGRYYLYAEIYNLSVGYTVSDFKPVTIQKADVIPTNTDNFTGYYSYDGAIGKIKLSELGINTFYHNDAPITAEWKNSKDQYVSGKLQWLNPDEEVDSTNDGETRKVKFVPTEYDADRYNEYVVEDAATLFIEKYEVYRPELDGFSSETWDGENHDIKLRNSNNYESFVSLVDVTHEGNPITLGDDGLLGTANEIGEYTYNFALKDKVNYYWNGGEEDTIDVEDKSIAFTINPLLSFVNLYVLDNHNIDENCQIIIPIKPGTEEGENCNASPYVEGTLQVQFLTEYTYNPENPEGSTEKSNVDATCEVKKVGGYDCVVITVTDFKEQTHNGWFLIKITAEGAEHFDDIESVTTLVVEKYKGTITCPIEADTVIEKTVGTKVKELYEGYPELDTKLGKWVMYFKATPGSEWALAPMELELPSGEYSFKAVYESGFVLYAGEISPVEFTIKGIQN